MTKYKLASFAWGGEKWIVPVEVVRETDKFVTYISSGVEHREAKGGRYFDSFEEARLYKQEMIERRLKSLNEELARQQKLYEEIKALKEDIEKA